MQVSMHYEQLSSWRIDRAQASHTGDREFGSWSSQTNDLKSWHLLLPSLLISINKIGQGLVSSVSR